MRTSNRIIAVALAGIAGAAMATSALAQAAAPAPAINYMGSKFVAIDGYKYGGQLPVGAEKNLDALRVLIKAADSLGQIRDNQYGGSTHLVVGDTTPSMRLVGAGTWNGEKVSVRFDWDYRVPGVRLDITKANNVHEIQVAVGDLAWDEKTPGVYGGPAKTSANERLVLAYLMPSGVIAAAREAADKLKLSKAGASNVLTFPVPKLGADMVATLNFDNQPVHTEITVGGKKYSGDFGDFLADRGDYEVKFPHAVEIKVDGKSIAKWELEYHHMNPYLIFPQPKEVAAK